MKAYHYRSGSRNLREGNLAQLRRATPTQTKHALKCLKAAHIKTVRELAVADEGRLSKVQGCGNKSIAEIRERLADLSLTFNTVFDGHGNITSPDLRLIEKTRKLRRLTEGG